jgi:hypothetical protein
MRLSQMSEPSVSKLTLPGCVEVGESGKNYLEASLQLGVWCFAGLAKLEELRVQSRTVGRGLPTSAMNRQIPITDSEGRAIEDEMAIRERSKISQSLGGRPLAWTGNCISHIGIRQMVVSRF